MFAHEEIFAVAGLWGVLLSRSDCLEACGQMSLGFCGDCDAGWEVVVVGLGSNDFEVESVPGSCTCGGL